MSEKLEYAQTLLNSLLSAPDISEQPDKREAETQYRSGLLDELVSHLITELGLKGYDARLLVRGLRITSKLFDDL